MKKIANVDWNQVLNDLKSVSSSGQSIVAAKGKGLGNYTFILDSAFAPGKPDAIAYVSTDKVDPVTGKFKVVIVNPVLQQFFKNYFQQHPNIKSYQDLTKAEFKEFKEAFLGEIANIILHEIAHMPEGGKFDPSKPGGGLRDEGYAKSQEKHASRGVYMKKDTLKILSKLSKDLGKSGNKRFADGVNSLLKKYAQNWEPGQRTSPFMPSSPTSPQAESIQVQDLGLKMIEHQGYTYEYNTRTKEFEVRFTPPGKEKSIGVIISARNQYGAAYKVLMEEAVKLGLATPEDVPRASPTSETVSTSSKPTSQGQYSSDIRTQYRSILDDKGNNFFAKILETGDSGFLIELVDGHKIFMPFKSIQDMQTIQESDFLRSVVPPGVVSYEGQYQTERPVGYTQQYTSGIAPSETPQETTPEWQHDGITYYIKKDGWVLCLVRKQSPSFLAPLIPGGKKEYVVWPPEKADSITTGGAATKKDVFDILGSVPPELTQTNEMVQDFSRSFYINHYPREYAEMMRQPGSAENPALDKLSKTKVETDAIKKIAAMKEVYDQAMIFGEKNPFGRTNTKYKG